tara:strand:+ start:1798 stop:2256 length:459 start_codon:yes stop_codon:yes gene_type:complete
MYLRRLGFPVEICEIILYKGALRGHLPINDNPFPPPTKYLWEYGRVIGDHNFAIFSMDIPTFDPIIEFLQLDGQDDMEMGRRYSIKRTLMELAYGGYYEEILEEKGILWMLDDCYRRFTDSVSGNDNKRIMEEWLLLEEGIALNIFANLHFT